MNNIFASPQLPERTESLKTGVISGFFTVLAFLLTSVINTWVPLNFQLSWWISTLFMGISGFLFGVTYRYVIRTDNNTHLQSGAVMAFGLVRGLAQLNNTTPNLSSILILAESIFDFAIAATILNFAIQKNWIKPFQG